MELFCTKGVRLPNTLPILPPSDTAVALFSIWPPFHAVTMVK